MPHAFDITTTTPSIKLSAAGEGELVFTVSNALRRPVRGRILAQPEGNTLAAWLAVSGLTERDFAADGTHQVKVQVKVPAGAPAGRYGFHLLVSSVINPDEDYAAGPSVSFEVVPSAPKKKPFPWWLVLLGAGVLVVGVGAVLLFSKLRGPGLNDPCDPAASDCPATMTCVPDRQVCLLNEGESCQRPEDCAIGRCEEGKCAFPPPGANCQADGDCPPPQKCVEVTPGVKACLLRPDQPCTRDIDCSSLWCLEEREVCSRDDGRCTDNSECRPPAFTCDNGTCRKVNGQPCVNHAECASGFCEQTCRPSPPCVPPCRRPQVCVRGRCQFIFFESPVFRFESGVRTTP